MFSSVLELGPPLFPAMCLLFWQVERVQQRLWQFVALGGESILSSIDPRIQKLHLRS